MSKSNPQNRKHFQKRCHGDRFILKTVQVPDLVFRHDNKSFKASRIAGIDMEESDNVPVYPLRAFRPAAGKKYACSVKVIVIPLRDDDAKRSMVEVTCPKCNKTFNARLSGQASPIAHLNFLEKPDGSTVGLSTAELLPVGNAIIKVKFRQGENVSAIARDPETGAFILPSPDWNQVLGQKLELHKEYEVAVRIELDGRQVATPVATVGNLRSTSMALALAEKSGFVTDFHRMNLIGPNGEWVHCLVALGIKPSPEKLKTVTKDEVKRAYHQRVRKYNTDQHEGSPLLELYKKFQQCINDARDMADLFIDGRDVKVAPADAPAEVVPQPEAAQVVAKAPATVKVVRQPKVSEKVETEASAPVETDELPETVIEPAPVEVTSSEAVEEQVPAKLAGEDLDKLAAALANLTLEDFNQKSNGHKKILRLKALASQSPKGSGQSAGKKPRQQKKERQSGLQSLSNLAGKLDGSKE